MPIFSVAVLAVSCVFCVFIGCWGVGFSCPDVEIVGVVEGGDSLVSVKLMMRNTHVGTRSRDVKGTAAEYDGSAKEAVAEGRDQASQVTKADGDGAQVLIPNLLTSLPPSSVCADRALHEDELRPTSQWCVSPRTRVGCWVLSPML